MSRIAALLRRRGWVRRVVPYTGYGSAGWVRVFARAVLAPPGTRNAQVAERVSSERSIRGWRSFASAQVPHAAMTVTIAGVEHEVTADRGGYLDVVLPAEFDAGWHEVHVSAGSEAVRAPVLIIGPEPATAVLSDVDDTVMVTALPRPILALWNAFVLHENARRPVPGMSELFNRLRAARGPGPTFYLSTGAWDTAPALRRFLSRHGFPPGPLLLTDWGPTSTGWFRSGRDHKTSSIQRLMRELPQLSWAFIGDDGQLDPEIYAEAVAEHPHRIEMVAIRRLTVAEQMLAHGIPQPLHQAHSGAAAHVLAGSDGHELLLRMVDAGLVPPKET